MKTVDRRTVLRCSGAAAASVAIRRSVFAFAGGLFTSQMAEDYVPVAKTRYGSIRGAAEDGVLVFRGVPYGADTAPVRFQAPLPPAPWTGVKSCDAFTTRAPQLTALRGLLGISGAPSLGSAGVTPAGALPRIAPESGLQSEDCLHLNVFTPGLRDHRKRPVLVYFHGGAYNNGSVNSALYDGKRLCRRGDVVVVTVNHRLNAFGFLYLAALDPKQYPDSGNVGMLDLVLALKWVRENIAEFGGDPSRVLDFWTIGRRREVRDVDGHACRSWPFPSRDDHERPAGERRLDRDRVQTHGRHARQTRHHEGESRGPENHALGEDSGRGGRGQFGLASRR